MHTNVILEYPGTLSTCWNIDFGQKPGRTHKHIDCEENKIYFKVDSGFHTGETGWWQDDSSVRGSGGIFHHPSGENFEFRSSQIASDAIWDKLSKQHIESGSEVAPLI